MGQGARKLWHAIAVAVNQIAAEETMVSRTFGVARFGHQPNMPRREGKHPLDNLSPNVSFLLLTWSSSRRPK
jgi:hypothetical protein